MINIQWVERGCDFYEKNMFVCKNVDSQNCEIPKFLRISKGFSVRLPVQTSSTGTCRFHGPFGWAKVETRNWHRAATSKSTLAERIGRVHPQNGMGWMFQVKQPSVFRVQRITWECGKLFAAEHWGAFLVNSHHSRTHPVVIHARLEHRMRLRRKVVFKRRPTVVDEETIGVLFLCEINISTESSQEIHILYICICVD